MVSIREDDLCVWSLMKSSKSPHKSTRVFLTTLLVASSMLACLPVTAQAEGESKAGGGPVRSQPCTIGVSTIAECFPDRGMATAVAGNVDDTTTIDEVLTEEMIDELDKVSIGGSVKSLAGIENLSKLTTLDLYSTSVEDLSPLDTPTLRNQMTTIEASNNKIKDISPLRNFTKLRSLSLSGNFITDISTIAGLNCDYISIRGQEMVLDPLDASDNPDQSLVIPTPIDIHGNHIEPEADTIEPTDGMTYTSSAVSWNSARGGTRSFSWSVSDSRPDGTVLSFSGTISKEVRVAPIVLALFHPSEPGMASRPQAIRVDRGHRLTPPSDPAYPGYRFLGWYTNAHGGTKHDFSYVLTDNITLYGHWAVDTGSPPGPGGGGTEPLPPINCHIGVSTYQSCFPDPVLAEAAAGRAPGNKTVTDVVTEEDIEDITYLDIRQEDGAIRSLNGIQVLTNLTELILLGQAKTVQSADPPAPLDLRPLTSLTQLTDLRISGGLEQEDQSTEDLRSGFLLEDLSPLGSLTNLTSLSINGTALSDLSTMVSFKNLHMLTELDLSHNNISDIAPLKNLDFVSIKELDLTYNAINDMSPLGAMPFAEGTADISVEDQLIIYKRDTRDPSAAVELPVPIQMSGLHLEIEDEDLTPALNGHYDKSSYSAVWDPPITDEPHCFPFHANFGIEGSISYGGRVCDRRTTAENPDRAVHRVHFDVNYDTPNPPKIDDQLVYDGDYARKPDGPIRRKYVLDHWSLDGAPFDFEHTPITRDLTLKAEWIPQYTVTFDTHGGNSIPEQTVPRNGLAVRPTDPVKAGATFAGWFTEPDGAGEEADFSKPVTSDVTLHAKWASAGVTANSKIPLTGGLPWLIILSGAAAVLILIGCLLYEIARRLD